MKICRAELTSFALPLRRPLRTASQVITERRGVLLQLQDEHGNIGWGEATPMQGFGFESETLEVDFEMLQQEIPAFLGKKIKTIQSLLDGFTNAAPEAPCALSALDTALCDLAAQAADLPLASWLAREWGTLPQKKIPANAVLAEESPSVLALEVQSRLGQGFRTLKLKVGADSLQADCARIAAVRLLAGPEIQLRLDANGAWTPEEAIEAMTAFSSYGIEFLEQPVPRDDLAGLATVSARGMVRVAADEAVSSPESANALIQEEACDLIVLKPSALGGPHATRTLAEKALSKSISTVFTSLLDGAVGCTMALHVAAALPGNEQLACGIATGDLIKSDLAPSPSIEGGFAILPGTKGLGVCAEASSLAELSTGTTEVLTP
jgi:o-succinylbenzoate synthase